MATPNVYTDAVFEFLNTPPGEVPSIVWMAEGIVWHDSLQQGHDFIGWSAIDALRQQLHRGFRGLNFRATAVRPAEKGHLIADWAARGTHLGEFKGVSVTGQKVSWEGCLVLRLTASDATHGSHLCVGEAWMSWDPAELFAQLGRRTGPVSPVALAQLYFSAYNSGDYEMLEGVVDPGYSYHGLLHNLRQLRGMEAMTAIMRAWRDSFPDITLTYEFMLESADSAIFRWVKKGTHTGVPFLGVPATQRPVVVKGVTTMTVSAGKIAKLTSHSSMLDVFDQLGVTARDITADLSLGALAMAT